MATTVGTNIKIIDKEDRILIVIQKDAKLKDSGSGLSQIIAQTKKFENIGIISGTKFKDKELGLNLLLTVRPIKAVKAKKSKKARLDDDADGDE